MGEETPETNIKILRMKWKHRTIISYISLAAIMVVTIVVLFVLPVSSVVSLSSVLSWFYMGMTSVVGAYFGLSTWSEIKGK